ncbi:hypothetical protein [Streptomyces sp. NPDC001139]
MLRKQEHSPDTGKLVGTSYDDHAAAVTSTAAELHRAGIGHLLGFQTEIGHRLAGGYLQCGNLVVWVSVAGVAMSRSFLKIAGAAGAAAGKSMGSRSIPCPVPAWSASGASNRSASAAISGARLRLPAMGDGSLPRVEPSSGISIPAHVLGIGQAANAAGNPIPSRNGDVAFVQF